jgi:hypothetical protein
MLKLVPLLGVCVSHHSQSDPSVRQFARRDAWRFKSRLHQLHYEPRARDFSITNYCFGGRARKDPPISGSRWGVDGIEPLIPGAEADRGCRGAPYRSLVDQGPNLEALPRVPML